MSAPIPTLKTLAAQVASTQQPQVQLPADLINYLQNYADLTTVLTEHQAIFEDFQTLGVKMASVQNWTQQLRTDLINEANALLARLDTVLQLFGLAFNGIDQEQNPEWRDYYLQRLTIAHQELTQFRPALVLIVAQLTPLPDSDDEEGF
jgi:hypothetical protein